MNPNAPPQVKCKSCGEVKDHHGKGLCYECYRKQYSFPLRICKKCSRKRPHKALGLCTSCYEMQRRNK